MRLGILYSTSFTIFIFWLSARLKNRVGNPITLYIFFSVLTILFFFIIKDKLKNNIFPFLLHPWFTLPSSLFFHFPTSFLFFLPASFHFIIVVVVISFFNFFYNNNNIYSFFGAHVCVWVSGLLSDTFVTRPHTHAAHIHLCSPFLKKGVHMCVDFLFFRGKNNNENGVCTSTSFFTIKYMHTYMLPTTHLPYIFFLLGQPRLLTLLTTFPTLVIVLKKSKVLKKSLLFSLSSFFSFSLDFIFLILPRYVCVIIMDAVICE